MYNNIYMNNFSNPKTIIHNRVIVCSINYQVQDLFTSICLHANFLTLGETANSNGRRKACGHVGGSWRELLACVLFLSTFQWPQQRQVLALVHAHTRSQPTLNTEHWTLTGRTSQHLLYNSWAWSAGQVAGRGAARVLLLRTKNF
jgi:hypothetical protein